MSHVVINQETCPICCKNLRDGSDVVEAHQKVADGINNASVQRADDEVPLVKKYTQNVDGVDSST